MSIRSGWSGKFAFKVRIHPLFVLLLVGASFIGMLGEAFILFAIVIIHELSHAVVARIYGFRVAEVELLPFGGVAKLDHAAMAWSPQAESAIAVAGPVSNFLMIALGAFLHLSGLLPEPMVQFFIKSNMMIAFFNLLPALPLDGGRILRASLCANVGYMRATEVGLRMAFVLSFVFLAIGAAALWLGYMNIGLIVLAFFLFLSAWQLQRQLPVDLVRFLDMKRRPARTLLPVRGVAVPIDCLVRDVLRKFAPDAYHMIYVLDKDNHVTCTLREDQLLEHVFSGRGFEQTLRELLEYKK